MMNPTQGTMDVSPPRDARSTMLEDGLFAGMIGALLVAVWFLILDFFAGHPLYTPSLLGAVIVHGVDPAAYTVVEAQNVAIYTVIHFLAFIVIGVLASWLATLFERFAAVGIVLIFLVVFFELGFFALDLAIGHHLVGRLHAWAVGIGNVLAALGMASFLWNRHPGVARGFERVWDE